MVTIIHFCSLAWAVFAEISPGIICPLTALENYFASRAGILTYQEDFVSRYLVPVIYQENVEVRVQYLLVATVILINIIAYRRYGKVKQLKVSVTTMIVRNTPACADNFVNQLC